MICKYLNNKQLFFLKGSKNNHKTTLKTRMSNFKSLENVITDSGFVNYEALIDNPQNLKENINTLKNYQIDFKDRSLNALAFFCNAYNLYCMFLAFEKYKDFNKSFQGGFIYNLFIFL